MFVVAATGHHWWMDGIVAIALLWGGLKLDTFVRGRRPEAPLEPEMAFAKASRTGTGFCQSAVVASK